jgi:hypothetical protein
MRKRDSEVAPDGMDAARDEAKRAQIDIDAGRYKNKWAAVCGCSYLAPSFGGGGTGSGSR